MKAYKIELLVIDHHGLRGEGIKREIEVANYPNDCINPRVMNITEAEIGFWHDDHPLNKRDLAVNEYRSLFL